jgi:hypothetical protein
VVASLTDSLRGLELSIDDDPSPCKGLILDPQ